MRRGYRASTSMVAAHVSAETHSDIAEAYRAQLKYALGQRACRAVHDAVREARCLRQHIVGVKSRGGDLRFIESRIRASGFSAVPLGRREPPLRDRRRTQQRSEE